MTRVTRGRFLVIQVLVLALFCTLFTRLWYVQVVGGETYRAKAHDNAVREVDVAPQRGLITDSQGRPIASNRLSWVITVDRSALAQLSEQRQRRVLEQLAKILDVKYQQLLDRTKLCGEKGAPKPPLCWNGSPYEPVPVAQDVGDDVALSVQESAEDFPAVRAEKRNVRAYPSPKGANAAHVLGYLSPVTEDEYEAAKRDGDETINPSSLVGRSGLERAYDEYLRGVPGSTGKLVDSQGQVIGKKDATPPKPGDTLVTSIDAKVQALAEEQLHKAIDKARKQHDDVTGRNYEATAGSVVVMDPDNGRVVASASYPNYDPSLWVDGITSKQLDRLYSKKAGEPLLNRAIQAQLAPGSTFKPFTALGALDSGYDRSTQLSCPSSLQVGNRTFKNYESQAYGLIGFERALQVSCDTFFYQIAYDKWKDNGGADAGPKSEDDLVENAKAFGFGAKTGIDLPSEAGGRIADRGWRREHWEKNKDYYCKLAKHPDKAKSDYQRKFARQFCATGYLYGPGDAVNFAIGQGDTTVTPMQLAVAYGAVSNGGTLWEPSIGKAIVSPDGEPVKKIKPEKAGSVPVSDKNVEFVDQALRGTAKSGTMSWKMQGFPLDDVHIRAKTGTAEVQGQQTTGWLATYDENYVVIMMIEQGGTGSGSSGDAVRNIWEGLYGVEDGSANPKKALLPGADPPDSLPVFTPDGRIRSPQ